MTTICYTIWLCFSFLLVSPGLTTGVLLRHDKPVPDEIYYWMAAAMGVMIFQAGVIIWLLYVAHKKDQEHL